MRSPPSVDSLLCPSAQADMERSRVFGVIEGTPVEPQVRYLALPTKVPEDVQDLCSPVAPEELFRFAAPCAQTECAHFNGQRCALGQRIAAIERQVAGTVPKCPIRSECRWWHEQGPSACMTCPRIVTHDFAPPDVLWKAAQVASPAETSSER